MSARPASALSQPAGSGVAARDAGNDGRREFAFTRDDFERIRKLIYDHAGISLAPIKFDMVYSRLARRLRARGDRSFAEYIKRLENNDAEEWETFVNSLTTNLTSFFREAHHFDCFARYIKHHGLQPVTVWCCASSTGEEPYSIAITACETFGRLDPPVRILASDLDTAVLAQAQAGVYAEERVERLSRERLQRFFQKGTGAQAGRVRVRPELRRLIEYRRINLLEPNWNVSAPLDIIFCRNVMIYFDKPTQHKILTRFRPLLKRDGRLYAGHSESFAHAADLFRPLGKTVYARTDASSD